MIRYDMMYLKYSQKTMTISRGKWRLIDLLSTLGYYVFGQTHISLPKIAPCLAKFRRRLQTCDSCVIQAPYFQRNLGSRLSTHGSTAVGVGAQVLNPSIPQEINIYHKWFLVARSGPDPCIIIAPPPIYRAAVSCNSGTAVTSEPRLREELARTRHIFGDR